MVITICFQACLDSWDYTTYTPTYYRKTLINELLFWFLKPRQDNNVHVLEEFFPRKVNQTFKTEFILQKEDLNFGQLKIVEWSSFFRFFQSFGNKLSWFFYVEKGSFFRKQKNP